jgi:hypothetical protein
MNRNTKIILGVLGGILIICLCLVVGGLLAVRNLGNSLVIDNPEEIRAAANGIADYALPPGYQEEGVINFIFGKMLMISAGDTTGPSARPVIMFMQLPADLLTDEEGLRAQTELGIQQAFGNRQYSLEYVGERNAIIREENVSLLIYEGVDENGVPFRQIISEVFPGKAGPTLLFILGPIRGWDDGEIDAFIRSLR